MIALLFTLILTISFIVIILLSWFKSEAIIEWASLLGLSKFIQKEEFYSKQYENLPLGLNYPTFLKLKYNNFITRLISCPLCLTMWISSFISLLLTIIKLNFIFVLLNPFITICSLILYGLITKLLNLP